MMDRMLQTLDRSYPLAPADTGEFSELRAGGMRFRIRAYHAQGLGRVSVMEASGFAGLMKMDTLIITPSEADLPIYSYDRIFAMGNDTLICELYDTLIGTVDLSPLDAITKQYADLPERDPGTHWYDGIKLSQSISKKAKKKSRNRMDDLALAHFEAYRNLPASTVTDRLQKREKSAAYVNGLLQNGGPSTDVFLKALGREATETLFRRHLFGTDDD